MSRRQNREYKKGKPYRDHRKFVVIAEGEREDEYFQYFHAMNKRVIIAIVPRDKGRSACKYFLERERKYNEESGIEPEDSVWFIMDVDKWLRAEIESLQAHCKNNENRNLAISNPCFEVWLYFHFGNPGNIAKANARVLKQKLNTLVHGGYKRDLYAKNIGAATKNAKIADQTPKHYYPSVMNTKVYKLAEELLMFLGTI